MPIPYNQTITEGLQELQPRVEEKDVNSIISSDFLSTHGHCGEGVKKRSTSAVVKSQSKQKSKHNSVTLSYQLYEYYLPRDKVLNQTLKAS